MCVHLCYSVWYDVCEVRVARRSVCMWCEVRMREQGSVCDVCGGECEVYT